MAPRLPKNRNTPANPSAPPREAVPGDNIAALEEAERVQLISFVSRLTDADAKVEEAKAPFDAAKKARTQVFNLAKAAGFSREELERRMEEMNGTNRDNAEQAAREARHRRWLGILTPEQQKMHLGDETPQEAKDEYDARSAGYRVGLRGLAAKPPADLNARFVQPWLEGHADGYKAYQAALEAAAPKPLKSTANDVAAQAARDFAADNPEVNVDEAARKLKADPKFMARGPAEEEPFEATPEELAAQSGRRQPEEAGDTL